MKKLGELESSAIKTRQSNLFVFNPHMSYPPDKFDQRGSRLLEAQDHGSHDAQETRRRKAGWRAVKLI